MNVIRLNPDFFSHRRTGYWGRFDHDARVGFGGFAERSIADFAGELYRRQKILKSNQANI